MRYCRLQGAKLRSNGWPLQPTCDGGAQFNVLDFCPHSRCHGSERTCADSAQKHAWLLGQHVMVVKSNIFRLRHAPLHLSMAVLGSGGAVWLALKENCTPRRVKLAGQAEASAGVTSVKPTESHLCT